MVCARSLNIFKNLIPLKPGERLGALCTSKDKLCRSTIGRSAWLIQYEGFELLGNANLRFAEVYIDLKFMYSRYIFVHSSCLSYFAFEFGKYFRGYGFCFNTGYACVRCIRCMLQCGSTYLHAHWSVNIHGFCCLNIPWTLQQHIFSRFGKFLRY